MAPRGLRLAVAAAALLLLHSYGAEACTRIVLSGPNDSYVLSGRSQDWGGPPLKVDAWVLPRGGTAETTLVASNRSLTYEPKHGSVVISLVDSHVTQGMNEVGLTADLLNLYNTNFTSSVPAKAAQQKEKPLVAATTLVAVVLQNFQTVAEAVEYFRADNITIMDVSITVDDPNGIGSVKRDNAINHMALTDATGDSAIIEWVAGSPIIYHNRSYVVATNDPTYDQQLENWKGYWRPISEVFMPGHGYSIDRFVRASHYVEQAILSDDVYDGIAQLFSFHRGTNDPINITPPAHAKADASNTQYITVSDLTNKKLYYSSMLHPMHINFWVDLSKIDFDDGKIKKLALAGPQWNRDTALLLDQTDKFVPAELPDWLFKTIEDALAVYDA